MSAINYTITDGNLEDIIVTAFEGGINYWCEEVEVVDNDYKGAKDTVGAIINGADVWLHDAEDDDSVILNRANLIAGIEKFMEENEGLLTMEDGILQVDCGQVDSDIADSMIQIAVFGEAKFG